MKKRILTCFVLVVMLLAFVSCSKEKVTLAEKTAPVAWAGLRCSHYGIKPFPSNDKWLKYAEHMQNGFDGSSGTFVWIIGSVGGNIDERICTVNFPLEHKIEHVQDFPIDENQEFLTMCDEKGYSVWLQVEPGQCDVADLAAQTMRRYKDHPSVKGFGIDVEWYGPAGTDGWGIPFTDEVAKKVDKAIKKVDKRFNFFVKHWDCTYLPETYRSDIVFVNDSQQFKSVEEMKDTFGSWANFYHPNPVMFQIGYPADEEVWRVFENPEWELGKILADEVADDQNVGIVWVDFTLKQVMGKKVK